MLWDYVIYMSSYGVAGPNAEWWKQHFEVPVLSTPSDTAAVKIIENVEGHPAGSGQTPLAIADAVDPKRGTKRPASENVTCDNWNANKGACKGGVKTCPAGRVHACKICGSTKHRAKDHRKETFGRGGGGDWQQTDDDKDKDKTSKASKRQAALRAQGANGGTWR